MLWGRLVLLLGTLCVLGGALTPGIGMAAQGDAKSPAAPAAPTMPAPSAGGSGASAGISVPAFRKANRVAIITIKGPIESGGMRSRSVTAASVERRIKIAEQSGADAIVFEIDTPGGDVAAVIDMCTRIKESSIQNTVAWVHSDAYSGGAVTALACREIVTSGAGKLGDAMPIQFSPFTGARAADQDQLKKKILPVLVSEVLDSARRHNEFFNEYRRDEYLTQAIVANDVELWRIKNKKTGVEVCVDRQEYEMLFPGAPLNAPAQLGGAPTTEKPKQDSTPKELVPDPNDPSKMVPAPYPSGSEKLAAVYQAVQNQVNTQATRRPVITAADRGDWVPVERVSDGTSAVVMNSGQLVRYGFANNPIDPATKQTVWINSDDDLKAFMGATQVRRLDQSWSEGLVIVLTSMWMQALLVVIFLVALFVEMTHPGLILPGVISVCALGLFLAPPLLIGMASWWAVAAVLVGLMLLGLELFVLPGFGVAGIIGMVLLFGGLVGVFAGSDSLFPDTAQERHKALLGLSAVALAMFTSGVAIYFIGKNFGSLPMLNRLVLKSSSGDEDEPSMLEAMDDGVDAPVRVGEEGVAITAMRPSGKVQVGDRVVDAVAEMGYLPAGERVRVVNVTEFRVGVERAGTGGAANA